MRFFGNELPCSATGNEMWSNTALHAVRQQTEGTPALVIGQGHATSVLPQLAAQLDTLAFVGLDPGHTQVFEARMETLRAMLPDDGEEVFGSDITAVLEDKGYLMDDLFTWWFQREGMTTFDHGRQNNPQNVVNNSDRRADLVRRYPAGSLDLVSCVGDIKDRCLPNRIGELGNLSWVHLYNVAEMSRNRSLAGSLIDFMEGLHGISDDTLVTYSVHDNYREDDWWPSVHTARPEDITIASLTRAHDNVPCLRDDWYA